MMAHTSLRNHFVDMPLDVWGIILGNFDDTIQVSVFYALYEHASMSQTFGMASSVVDAFWSLKRHVIQQGATAELWRNRQATSPDDDGTTEAMAEFEAAWEGDTVQFTW